MAEKVNTQRKAKEILQILKANGPLAIGSIAKLLDPPMRKRRLRDSLLRLHKRGFVRRRYEGVPPNRIVFHQINQTPDGRKKVAKYLNCEASDIRQAYFSRREAIFNARTAHFAHELKKLFPEANFIRNFEIQIHQVASKILQSTYAAEDLWPDLLMILPSNEEGKSIFIAAEIEKYGKSPKALRRKVKKYGQTSEVDGVVFLCEPDRVIDILDDIYLERFIRQTCKQKPLRDFFFVISNSHAKQLSTETLLITPGGQACSLKNWIMLARHKKEAAPKNYQQSTSAGPG